MKLNTKHFGEIDVDESKIIYFSEGIPGFENLRDFVLIDDPEGGDGQDSVFCWLQSVEEPATAFVLVDMIRYNPEYNPLVSADRVGELGEYNDKDFFVYNIAVVPDDVSNMTVNLKAPLLINSVLKKGKQVICENDEYTVRHYLFK